ncbi:MAG: 30S ribosomal protein S5 [Candidatus Parvarchaeota archaeon]|nr:30S ribosomal protein S5 [Candidatus Parvarchaeota archaeon]MCW1301993.1 30S ribosomal protein S5 [Candidatus Parvarchaeota archaeon]
MENDDQSVVEAQAEGAKEQTKTYNFRTELGKRVLSGEIKDIDDIFAKNIPILEAGIVDFLIPDLKTEFLYVGQSKGKLGGGKRRIVRNTQKVTAEGKTQHFSAMAVVGDGKGHIGVGRGRGLESVIAKEKAVKNAKLNLIKIKFGCGSWECTCHGTHSIPFKVDGKSGSVRVTLIPAPKGIGLCVADDIKIIMRLAGIKDVWSKVEGKAGTRVNLGYAVFDALHSLNVLRYNKSVAENLGIK